MVLVKVKGFISNIYVCLNMMLSIFDALFLAVLSYFVEQNIIFSIALFFAVLVFACFSRFLYVRYVYSRFYIDENGIKCGKQYITYDGIKEVKLNDGIVAERVGIFDIDNFSGQPEGVEIYTEDMICINCDYDGFRRTEEEKIYIPRNKKTDMILKKYCKEYADFIFEYEKNNTNSFYKPSRPKKKHIFLLTISILIFSLLILTIVSQTSGCILGSIISIICFIIAFLSRVFRGYISFLLKKMIIRAFE